MPHPQEGWPPTSPQIRWMQEGDRATGCPVSAWTPALSGRPPASQKGSGHCGLWGHAWAQRTGTRDQGTEPSPADRKRPEHDGPFPSRLGTDCNPFDRPHPRPRQTKLPIPMHTPLPLLRPPHRLAGDTGAPSDTRASMPAARSRRQDTHPSRAAARPKHRHRRRRGVHWECRARSARGTRTEIALL